MGGERKEYGVHHSLVYIADDFSCLLTLIHLRFHTHSPPHTHSHSHYSEFPYQLTLSTRPESYMGSIDTWSSPFTCRIAYITFQVSSFSPFFFHVHSDLFLRNLAEDTLKSCLSALGGQWTVEEGGAMVEKERKTYLIFIKV